jgi:hypothetical protein
VEGAEIVGREQANRVEDNWLGKLEEKLPDCRVAIEIPFRKNSSDRLGMVFVIPRKKVLLSRKSVCLGIAQFEFRNGTKRNGFLKKNEI